jgi:hypothetical protein
MGWIDRETVVQFPDIFIISEALRPVLMPKQHQIQWVPGALPLADNHSLPYTAENKWSYTSASLLLPLWELNYSVWVTD